MTPHHANMLAASLALLCASGCDNDLPTGPSGISITGTVAYTGTAHADMVRPAVEVALFASFPPSGPPYATATLVDPDFSSGALPFTLEFVPESFDYFLVAQIIDIATAPAGEPVLTAPVGGFPDVCALSGSTGGLMVGSDAVEDVAVTIYDNSGADDPCNVPPVMLCPSASEAAVRLTLDAPNAGDIGARDTLIIGLFEAWPPAGPPAVFDVVQSSDIAFPYAYLNDAITPGNWSVYGCLDRNGDNLIGICGDADTWAVIDNGTPIELTAGQVHNITLDLESGTSEVVRVPPDASCP